MGISYLKYSHPLMLTHEFIYYPYIVCCSYIPSEECLVYPMTILPDYLKVAMPKK